MLTNLNKMLEESNCRFDNTQMIFLGVTDLM